jgi:membrane-associated protease RseP (regulator of RpoE activity)
MNGYLVALVVVVLWIVGAYALHRTKWLEKHSMSLYGPFIMWKTKKGKDFIDGLAAHTRFWNIYAKASLWICAAAMALIMLLLLWEATIVSRVPEPPSPELILGIPGLNPVIPVGYGILALAVAIVVHELAHGVLTRVGGMKVQSLGLLFLVFPMGAFVEPDEKALQETTRSKRSKVFATGPATNIILALIILGLFSGVMMSSVEVSHEGSLVTGVVSGSPAQIAGIDPSSLIVSIGGVPIASADDFAGRVTAGPGQPVDIDYYFSGELRTARNVTDGIVVSYTVSGYAAGVWGLEPGMVLVSINGTDIGSSAQLSAAMNDTRPGQDVSVVVLSYNEEDGAFVVSPTITHVVLSSKYDYYEEFYPDENKLEYADHGYLGAGFLMLGTNYRDADYYASILANPFEGDRSLDDFSMSWLRLIALPFLDLAPLRSPVTDLYEPSGALSWMPDQAFWLITNSLYWIFWLNLMVGLTNVLPAVPLDGGYIFRDGMDYLVSKLRKGYSKAKREEVVGSVTLMLALLVLALIVWQIVGPAL